MPYKILFCTCMFNLVRVESQNFGGFKQSWKCKKCSGNPKCQFLSIATFYHDWTKNSNKSVSNRYSSCDSWKSYHNTNFSPLVMLFAFEVVQVLCFLKLWPLSFMQNYCDQYFVVVSSECSVDKRIEKYPQSRKYHPDNVSSHSHQTNNIILGLTTRHSQSQANTMSEIQFQRRLIHAFLYSVH